MVWTLGVPVVALGLFVAHTVRQLRGRELVRATDRYLCLAVLLVLLGTVGNHWLMGALFPRHETQNIYDPDYTWLILTLAASGLVAVCLLLGELVLRAVRLASWWP